MMFKKITIIHTQKSKCRKNHLHQYTLQRNSYTGPFKIKNTSIYIAFSVITLYLHLKQDKTISLEDHMNIVV